MKVGCLFKDFKQNLEFQSLNQCKTNKHKLQFLIAKNDVQKQTSRHPLITYHFFLFICQSTLHADMIQKKQKQTRFSSKDNTQHTHTKKKENKLLKSHNNRINLY